MRYLAIAPLAVAAAMSFSSLAFADEYVSQQNRENYAVQRNDINAFTLPDQAQPVVMMHTTERATDPVAANPLPGGVFSDQDAHWGPGHNGSPAQW